MCTLDRLACVCTTGVQLPWADREALGGPGRGGGGSGDLPQDPHLPQGRGRCSLQCASKCSLQCVFQCVFSSVCFNA
eukprot:1977867-Pyramimonas_sp.AAC.2